MGRKEDALREGRGAVELLPVTKDALAGAAVLTNLAITYAWAGEKDLAIKQLEELVRIPSPVSYGQLRLHPFWDPLRGNAYFAEGIQEEILTRLAKIADLKVISRTSTQQYQSKPGNLSEIAKQLGVADNS